MTALDCARDGDPVAGALSVRITPRLLSSRSIARYKENKPGSLNEEEMNEIRKHPRLGYDALSAQGGFPREMLDVVLHHHEFLDGSGYPDGLREHEISDIPLLWMVDRARNSGLSFRAEALPAFSSP